MKGASASAFYGKCLRVCPFHCYWRDDDGKQAGSEKRGGAFAIMFRTVDRTAANTVRLKPPPSMLERGTELLENRHRLVLKRLCAKYVLLGKGST